MHILYALIKLCYVFVVELGQPIVENGGKEKIQTASNFVSVSNRGRMNAIYNK